MLSGEPSGPASPLARVSRVSGSQSSGAQGRYAGCVHAVILAPRDTDWWCRARARCCVFCRIVAGTSRPTSCSTTPTSWRSSTSRPVFPGHVLLVPARPPRHARRPPAATARAALRTRCSAVARRCEAGDRRGRLVRRHEQRGQPERAAPARARRAPPPQGRPAGLLLAPRATPTTTRWRDGQRHASETPSSSPRAAHDQQLTSSSSRRAAHDEQLTTSSSRQAEQVQARLESLDHDVVAPARLPRLPCQAVPDDPVGLVAPEHPSATLLLVPERAVTASDGRVVVERAGECVVARRGRRSRTARRRRASPCRCPGPGARGPSHEPVATSRSFRNCSPMMLWVPTTRPSTTTTKARCQLSTVHSARCRQNHCNVPRRRGGLGVGPRDRERHGGGVVHASRGQVGQRRTGRRRPRSAGRHGVSSLAGRTAARPSNPSRQCAGASARRPADFLPGPADRGRSIRDGTCDARNA